MLSASFMPGFFGRLVLLLACGLAAAGSALRAAESDAKPAVEKKDAKSSRTRENTPASADLTAEDVQSIRRALAQFGDLFLDGGKRKPATLLFAGKDAQRQYISAKLESEFKQSRYLDFEVLAVDPDLSLEGRGVESQRHIVDVTLRYVLVKCDALPPALLPKVKSVAALDRKSPAWSEALKQLTAAGDSAGDDPALAALRPYVVANTNVYSFTVQKDKSNGAFLLLDSSFLGGLGLRRGVWEVVGNALLALIVGVALLAFWIWMIWAAHKARPSRRVWRILAWIPLAGGVIFFVLVYLPGIFRRVPASAK